LIKITLGFGYSLHFGENDGIGAKIEAGLLENIFLGLCSALSHAATVV
jgi:hypothetical protein